MLAQILVQPSEPETLAYIAAHGGLTDFQEVAVEVFVRRLKISGLWSQVRAVWPLVGDTWERQRLNLKNPETLPLEAVGGPPALDTHGVTGGAAHAAVTVPLDAAARRTVYLRWRNAAAPSEAPLLSTDTGLAVRQGIDGPGSFGAAWGADARAQIVWPYDSERGHRSVDLGLSAASGLQHMRGGGSAAAWQPHGGTEAATVLPSVFTLVQDCPHTLGHFALIESQDALGDYGRFERDLADMLGRPETTLLSNVLLWADGFMQRDDNNQPIPA